MRDITLGQHIPGNSVLHRADPRLKLALVVAYIVVLFIAPTLLGIGLSALFLVWLYSLSKIPLKMVMRSFKSIIPIVIFTAVMNMFFTAGDPIFSFWIFTVTKQGALFSVQLILRIICMLAATTLLTYTTSPLALTDAIERTLSPLKVMRFPVHEISMMMTIALRFIPLLVEETDKIMNAQKARGAQLDTGKLKERVQALIPILIPLFISAFRRADELATAMECRCYRGGDGRTRIKVMKFTKEDVFCAFVCAAIFVGIFFSKNIPFLVF